MPPFEPEPAGRRSGGVGYTSRAKVRHDGYCAPAEAVWPWVAQVRLAPYAYGWIDNRGRRSPRELVGLPEPHVGERFSTAGGRKVGRIVSVDPGKQLTGIIMGAFMSYVLVPQEGRRARESAFLA